MSNTYNWIITRLDCYPNQDGYENVVSTIYWSRQVKDNEARSVSISGVMGIEFNKDNTFTPYSSLTFETVKLWLENTFGVNGVNELDLSLDKSLQDIINPSIITKKLPWIAGQPDARFYDIIENADGSWTAIPKDLDGLKKTWEAQFKQTAYAMLSTSDWMVVRKQENDTAIPADWTSYREAVRTTCALAITDMNATTEIEAFITAVTTVQWPKDPNSIDAIQMFM